MNNLKKVGLTALAGSLAMMTVAQSEIVVSGSGEVTYTTSEGASGTTGNPVGVSQSVSFTGNGELDNGFTYSFFTSMAAQDMTADSSSFMLDMGDAGAVGVDQGVGKFGIGTIALTLPTAYEEADHGVGVLADGLDVVGDAQQLGYIGTFGGLKVNVEFDPTLNGATQQAGANGVNGGTGSNMNYALSYTIDDNWSVMYGASKTDYTLATSDDDTEQTGTVKYTMGAITAAYQRSEIQSGTDGTSGESVEAMGIAFNVNDNLSISVGQQDNTLDVASGTDVTEEATGVQAAYTMGSASVRLALNSADNVGGVANVSGENMEISLKLSF
jgi:outer membrane protein OmpU